MGSDVSMGGEYRFFCFYLKRVYMRETERLRETERGNYCESYDNGGLQFSKWPLKAPGVP